MLYVMTLLNLTVGNERRTEVTLVIIINERMVFKNHDVSTNVENFKEKKEDDRGSRHQLVIWKYNTYEHEIK